MQLSPPLPCSHGQFNFTFHHHCLLQQLHFSRLLLELACRPGKAFSGTIYLHCTSCDAWQVEKRSRCEMPATVGPALALLTERGLVPSRCDACTSFFAPWFHGGAAETRRGSSPARSERLWYHFIVPRGARRSCLCFYACFLVRSQKWPEFLSHCPK